MKPKQPNKLPNLRVGRLAYVPGGVSITTLDSHCNQPPGMVNL